MGVDVILSLPEDVRLGDAADVMGVLAGLPISEKPIKNSNGLFIHVEGVSTVGNIDMPEMATILLNGQLVDGETSHYTNWHFEPDSGVGRLIMPRSTAFWIALCRGLVDFFGGELSYQDLNDKLDYTFDQPLPHHVSNDPEWSIFQQRKLDIVPLTSIDLVRCKLWAAYKN